MEDKLFIICFDKKHDRLMITKLFKNYQSLVNNIYFEFPNIEIKSKHPINYVNK